MRVTATQLMTHWTCPFLWHVSYEVKEPLPVWGTRRRFGNVVHAAIAEYERRGRSLEKALLLLQDQRAGLTSEDLEEAQAILVWRHERAQEREGRAVLIEGSLRAQLGGHRLEVRMDRLDAVRDENLLAEYKGGKTVDLELVRTQLMILSYAILDVFRRAPETWEVELLRARKVLRWDAEKDPHALAHFTLGIVRAIEHGDREPRPYDTNFCRRCPARHHCPRWSSSPKPFSKTTTVKVEPQGLLF